MPNPWVSLRHDQLILVNKQEMIKNNWKKGWRRRKKWQIQHRQEKHFHECGLCCNVFTFLCGFDIGSMNGESTIK
jgi:hypothetical protein